MSQVFSLAQHQSVVLENANASSMDKIAIGLNWSAIQKGGTLGRLASSLFGSSVQSILQEGIDFDVSVVCINDDESIGEYVTATSLASSNGAITHSGDDASGDTGGDDGADNEIINVTLSKLPDHVKAVFTMLTVASNHTLDQAPSCMARIYDTHRTTRDTKSNMHFAEFAVAGNPKYRGMKGLILAKMSRVPGTNKWMMTVVDRPEQTDSLRVLANTCLSL